MTFANRYAGLCCGIALILTCAASPAQATFHLWQISEVYSNASGSVQYVDLVLPFDFDDESFLAGHAISAGLNSNSLIFGSNLPSVPVAGQHVLIATPGFSAVAGVVPDYTFPVAPFFDPNGDTLNYAGVDSFNFPALPSDGIHALDRSGSTVIAAPTNFAGVVGTVPEPSGLALGIAGMTAAWFAVHRRRRPFRFDARQ